MSPESARGFFKKANTRKQTARTAVTASGKAHIAVTAGRFQVAVPYHPDWPGKARELGGRWRHRTAFWSFPYNSRRVILQWLVRVFGVNILTPSWEETRQNLNAQATPEEKMREGL